MALTISFSAGAPCAANNHFAVTATAGARSVTVPLSRDEVMAPLTEDDIQTTVRVLVRLIVAQLAVKSIANVRQALNTKTIDLTVGG